MVGGERGIRTLGTFVRTTVFETATFNHSAISPQQQQLNKLPGPTQSGVHFIIRQTVPGRVRQVEKFAGVLWKAYTSALKPIPQQLL